MKCGTNKLELGSTNEATRQKASRKKANGGTNKLNLGSRIEYKTKASRKRRKCCLLHLIDKVMEVDRTERWAAAHQVSDRERESWSTQFHCVFVARPL